MAATGAVEAAFTVRTIFDGLIPPTVNLRTPDDTMSIDIATAPRTRPVPFAVSESFGFGGHNAALVLGAM